MESSDLFWDSSAEEEIVLVSGLENSYSGTLKQAKVL
jgi:hypothetical protein